MRRDTDADPHELAFFKAILNGSSRITRPITTNIGVTAGWPELRRLNGAACPHRQWQNLRHIPGGNIAKAYFRPQLPLELEFDTDTFRTQLEQSRAELTAAEQRDAQLRTQRTKLRERIRELSAAQPR